MCNNNVCGYENNNQLTNHPQLKYTIYNFLYNLSHHYYQLPQHIKFNIHSSFQSLTDYYNYTGIDLSLKSSFQRQRRSTNYTIEEYIDAIYYTIIHPFIKHKQNTYLYIYFHIPNIISQSVYQEEIIASLHKEMNYEGYYKLLNNIIQQFPLNNVMVQYNYLINNYIQEVLSYIDLTQTIGHYLKEV